MSIIRGVRSLLARCPRSQNQEVGTSAKEDNGMFCTLGTSIKNVA